MGALFILILLFLELQKVKQFKSAYLNSWSLDANVGLDIGTWILDTRLWTLDSGRWTLEAVCWLLTSDTVFNWRIQVLILFEWIFENFLHAIF